MCIIVCTELMRRLLHLAINKEVEVVHAYGLVVVNPQLDLLEAL